MLKSNEKQTEDFEQKIQEIICLMQDIEKDQSRRSVDQLVRVTELLFGNVSQPGILAKLYNEAPLEMNQTWKQQLRQVLERIQPSSVFFKRLNESKEHRVTMNNELLPSILQMKDSRTYEASSRIDVRSVGKGYLSSVSLFDFYFMSLLYRLFSLKQRDQQMPETEMIEYDDMYFHIIRNPFILCLNKYLTHYGQYTASSLKIIEMIEMYFVKELNIRHCGFKRNSSTLENKDFKIQYQLKSHYLEVMFLLIKCKQESFSAYHEYFRVVSENFQVISSPSASENTLRWSIRAWMYLITKGQNIEDQFIEQIDQAFHQNCLKVRRKNFEKKEIQGRFEEIIHQSMKSMPLKLEITNRINQNFIKLLKKENLWTINGAFLHTLFHFLLLNYLVEQQTKTQEISPNHKKIESQQQSFQNQQEVIFKKINNRIEDYQKKKNLGSYSLKIKAILKDLYNIDFDQQSNLYLNGSLKFNEKGDREIKINKQKSLMTYHSISKRSCWEFPIKGNEFSILLNFWYFVAAQVERILPSQQENEHPRLNLRFLANPLILTSIIVCILMIAKFLF